MDSGILMIQDSILVCSPDPRIPHTALLMGLMVTTMMTTVKMNKKKRRNHQPFTNIKRKRFSWAVRGKFGIGG
jgi:hypothetical protein